MSKLLTIQVLGWNGAKHLCKTAEALKTVPADITDIRYIDNGSTDNSLNIIQEILPKAHILKLDKNYGFAQAQNIGIAKCTTPYILTLDQDQEIIWEGIEKLLEVMEANPKLGAVQGKLYRQAQALPSPVLGEGAMPEDRQAGEGKFNATTAPHPLPLLSKERGIPVIDSCGIIQTLSFNGKEIGSNEEDTGQYEDVADLLAVTGGCGMYRMEALRSVASPHPNPLPVRGEGNDVGEVFDEKFFAYKEDVDLGWRLNNAGWQVKYIPVLVSYHARTLGKRGIFNWGLSIKNIQERINSPRTKWSLRNYIWMIAKNAGTRELILHAPFIITRLFVFFVLSLFSRDLFSVWKETWGGLKGMRGK